jgi:outer membrane protein assembly factor BamB
MSVMTIRFAHYALALLISSATAHAVADDATTQVLEYHGDAARSGHYVVPALSWEAAAGLHRDPQFQAQLAGPVYTQPLYWHPPGGRALLLVATEQNLVYALDAQTGAPVWKVSVGAPVPRSVLPCGNIDPLGITGTPVIDAHSQALFLDAMVLDKTARAPRHLIVGLSLKDGSMLPGWPIDVEAVLKASAKSFNSSVQNQRGALALAANTVYVPYGGHFGDCGDYRGWVVGVSLDSAHAVHSWSTRARGGGAWATGGVSADASGIYLVTGNTMGAAQWGDGEAVIRLSPGLAFSATAQDFFAPSDWQQLDSRDVDLGGTNAPLLSVPGATPSELVLALGKDGNAYLLSRAKLGGMGTSLLTQKVSPSAIRTSPAYVVSGDAALVAFQGTGANCPGGKVGDLTMLKITAGSPPGLTTAWCAAANGRGSPIITTTDGRANATVWVIGAEDSNRLRGFRADTGAVVFAGGAAPEAMGEVRRFQTLIAVERRLYVAADQHVYAFTF